MMFAMSIPGLALLLLVLAAGERAWQVVRRRRGHPVVSATAMDEFTTLFNGGKHIELEQRQVTLMLGEDEETGAPPRGPIDLDSGAVRLAGFRGGPPTDRGSVDRTAFIPRPRTPE